MATEDRWHDFAKEKPSEDMEGRDFIVSNGYSDTISMWCGGYWENEPFMGSKLCDEVVRWKGYLTPEEEKANEATRTELLAEKDAEIAELKKQMHDLCARSMDVSGKTIDKVSVLMAENERLSKAIDKERDETIKYMDELCKAKNEIESLKYSVATLETDIAMMKRWRKVSEELPEKQEWVFVSDGKHRMLCKRVDGAWLFDGAWMPEEHGKIEYWMPLPEAPKEADK